MPSAAPLSSFAPACSSSLFDDAYMSFPTLVLNLPNVTLRLTRRRPVILPSSHCHIVCFPYACCPSIVLQEYLPSHTEICVPFSAYCTSSFRHFSFHFVFAAHLFPNFSSSFRLLHHSHSFLYSTALTPDRLVFLYSHFVRPFEC